MGGAEVMPGSLVQPREVACACRLCVQPVRCSMGTGEEDQVPAGQPTVQSSMQPGGGEAATVNFMFLCAGRRAMCTRNTAPGSGLAHPWCARGAGRRA